MQFPKPSLPEYVGNTAVVVGIVVVLQYAGVVSEAAAALNVGFLTALAVSFAAFTYLVDVVTENAGQDPSTPRSSRTATTNVYRPGYASAAASFSTGCGGSGAASSRALSCVLQDAPGATTSSPSLSSTCSNRISPIDLLIE